MVCCLECVFYWCVWHSILLVHRKCSQSGYKVCRQELACHAVGGLKSGRLSYAFQKRRRSESVAFVTVSRLLATNASVNCPTDSDLHQKRESPFSSSTAAPRPRSCQGTARHNWDVIERLSRNHKSRHNQNMSRRPVPIKAPIGVLGHSNEPIHQ